MWFKQLLGHTKHETAPTTTVAPAPVSTIENPPTKAAAARHDAASHRQPLGVVSIQPVDRHRPAADDGKKPAKAARIDPAAAVACTAPAPTVAPAPAATAAPVSGPITNVPSAAPASSTAAAHRVPDLSARRKAFGPCPADIDSADIGDPMFCSTYVQEIYDFLRKKEAEDAIDPNYMSRQNHISAKMRTVLIDWMVEVQLKFRMTSETLYLSVNIVDKYLQKCEIKREQLQLLGVTAMLIASKFEEVIPIEINDFVYICENVCTAENIIKFEGEILRVIQWGLTSPCPLHFLRRYSKAAGSDGSLHTMSKYLLELSLGSYPMLKYLPSTQAAAAVLLTRKLTGRSPDWPESVEYHSGYRKDEIIECARDMLELVKVPDPKFRLVTRKYSGTKLCCVARTASENAPNVTL